MQAGSVKVSNGTVVETSIVLYSRYGAAGLAEFHTFLSDIQIQKIPVTDDHVSAAEKGYARFGKGRGHPAQLNYGDCFSYALAKLSGEPLLCKGNDFLHTDIDVVRLAPAAGAGNDP